jgi:LPS sulfotransferase NodH
MRGIIVCATPRCGSNYLCQLMASTRVLGVPREYFNPVGRRKYDDPDYPDDPREMLGHVLSTGATDNGMYAVKVHPFQLREIGDVDPLTELPGARTVRLQRLDRLGQALSWARAQQTGQFRLGDTPAAEPAYDRDLIDSSRRFLDEEEAWWDSRLAGRDTLVVSYEQLVADPKSVVAAVGVHAGVPEPVTIDPSQVTVQVQRDETSAEWVRRYSSGD